MSSSRSHRDYVGTSSGADYQRPQSGGSRSRRIPTSPPNLSRLVNNNASSSKISDKRSGDSRTKRRSRSRSRSRSPAHIQPSASKRHDDNRRIASTTRTRTKSPPASRKLDSKSNSSLIALRSPNVTRTAPSAKPIGRVLPEHIEIDLSGPDIIRRILNPDHIKIPRRPGEGNKPIFDRDELRESIERRMALDDNERNPKPPDPPFEQRVVAIIREPVEVMVDPYATSSTRSHGAVLQDTRERHSSHTKSSRDSHRRRESPLPSSSTAPYSSQRSISVERQAYEREGNRLELELRREEGRFRDNNRREDNYVVAPNRHENRSRSRSPLSHPRVRGAEPQKALPVESSHRSRQRDGNRERDLRETLSRPSSKPVALASLQRRVVEDGDSSRCRSGINRGGFAARRGRGSTFAFSRGRTFGLSGRVFRRPLEPKWEHDKYDHEARQQDLGPR